jgi:hypothetical protein
MIELHLGAHKTASTHLQKALRGASAGARDICFLGPTEMRAPEIGLEALLARGTADPLGAEAAAALRGRIGGAAHVLLSEENILGTAHSPKMLREGRFYPGSEVRVARLIAGIGGGPVRLHLAVRDPAGFLVSAYCQRLYAGHVLSFATFLDGLAPQAMRWSDLLERLLCVDGVDQCVLWQYEEYQAVMPQIVAGLLPAPLAATVRAEPGVVHPGLSHAAHAWVIAQAAAGRSPERLAREARVLWPKVPGVAAFAPLNPATLDASSSAYAADVTTMAAMPRVTLLNPPDAKA